MATITVTKGLVGTEDVSFESAGESADVTFSRTKAGGGTQSITKIGASHINIRDTGSIITATTVEGALAEIAGDVANVNVVFANGKGADITSAATIAITSRHLYFDVTGTTNISNITVDPGGAAGRMVILQFDSTLTVSDGMLRLAGDFSAQSGSHLGIIYDGTTWYELFRSTTGFESLGGGFDFSSATTSTDIHAGPLEQIDVDRLGPVLVSSLSADSIVNRGIPLNGFIGGQTEFI